MGPAVVSQSVLQVNLLVNQFFASFLATGFVTYLYYGNRLMQLPFGVLGVSIATVVFPLLSRQAHSGKGEEFSNTLTQALSTGFFIMVPCTVGIWVVAEPACRLAFEHGRFTLEAAQAAAEATTLYSLGLTAYTGVKILLPAYYARRDARRPLLTSITGMAVNAGLNLAAFLWVADSHLRFEGLALSSGLGAVVNMVLLLLSLPEIGVRLDWNFLTQQAWKILAASSIMGFSAWYTLKSIQSLHLPGARFWDFILPVMAGSLVYYGLAKVMGLTGLDWILTKRKERGKK